MHKTPTLNSLLQGPVSSENYKENQSKMASFNMLMFIKKKKSADSDQVRGTNFLCSLYSMYRDNI